MSINHTDAAATAAASIVAALVSRGYFDGLFKDKAGLISEISDTYQNVFHCVRGGINSKTETPD